MTQKIEAFGRTGGVIFIIYIRMPSKNNFDSAFVRLLYALKCFEFLVVGLDVFFCNGKHHF